MKIAIMGYGNLGRGVECAAKQNEDISLECVFTRRDPKTVKTLTGIEAVSVDRLFEYKDKIDVLIICGGSATDLPEMTPKAAEMFNVIDSFDTHAKIPEHFKAVDEAARKGGNLALISAGWDPGLFSLARLLFSSVLPEGKDYTFWGKGVSQGHSDAIRRIPGVIDARQYTVPIEETIGRIRNGETPELTARQKHKRECFVVAEEGADLSGIEKAIVSMPNYFSDYDTTVHFISSEELKRDHSGLPHGGFVIRNGKTGIGKENTHTAEFKLRLDSNPEFTSSVLIAYARAIYKMRNRGETGARSVFDIALSDLSPLSREELLKNYL